ATTGRMRLSPPRPTTANTASWTPRGAPTAATRAATRLPAPRNTAKKAWWKASRTISAIPKINQNRAISARVYGGLAGCAHPVGVLRSRDAASGASGSRRGRLVDVDGVSVAGRDLLDRLVAGRR